jgi:hypothetical protein
LLSEWPTTLGGRWGLFIVPTSKESLGRAFTGQVRWGTGQVQCNSLEVGLGPDLSGETPLKVGPEAL